jgi:hypothetical protein
MKHSNNKGAKDMAVMTLEQFENFAKTLDPNIDRKKVAKAMGLELPVVVEPIDTQLAGVGLVKHTPKVTKRNAAPRETLYVEVPSLKLDQTSGTRGFWVNARVARQIAQRILAVCDENSL